VPKWNIGIVGSIVDIYCCGVVWHGLYFRGGAAEISKKYCFISPILLDITGTVTVGIRAKVLD